MLRSTNERLNSVLGGSGYMNVEATIPIGFETVYESPVLDISRQAKRAIIESMRFIIPPEIIGKLSKPDQEAVSVMCSPLECGRVLEADQTVELDDGQKVLTFKGIGATGHVKKVLEHKLRNTDNKQLKNAWQGWLNELKRRRYLSEVRGLMSEQEAQSERLISERYEQLGISMQTVVGIYRILDLPNPRGETTDVETLKNIGFFHSAFQPAILVRAMRSNLRILDMLNLQVMRKEKHLDLLWGNIEEEYGSLKEYFFSVVDNIVRNNVLSMTAGMQIISANSIIHSRNISIHGEEIDFEKANERPEQDGLPFSILQSWPGVVRLLHHLLVRVGKKFNFSEEQLNELVECIIWQTLLETGKSRAVICKWQQAILKAWKFDQYNEMGLIMDYIPYSGLDGNSLDSDAKSARIRSSKTVGRHGKVVP